MTRKLVASMTRSWILHAQPTIGYATYTVSWGSSPTGCQPTPKKALKAFKQIHPNFMLFSSNCAF